MFTTVYARICVDPIRGTVGGKVSADNLYFNLFHYHPASGISDSENRGPVYFQLNNVNHFYCWINQNTSNQWRIGFTALKGPDPGPAQGPYTVANS